MAKSLKKSGGCSSTAYAGISDNYMLLDKAITKGGEPPSNDDLFGGGLFEKNMDRRGGNPFGNANLFKDITGGDPVKKLKGGDEPTKKDLKGGAERAKKLKGGTEPAKKLKGGDPAKKDLKGGDPAKKLKGGADDSQPPNALSMLGFGSAMKGFTDNLSSLTNIKGGDPKEINGGFASSKRCKDLKRTKGGTTGIELAPFISSLVMLGLRAANDKSLQTGITKKLGSMVSQSKKLKTKKSKSVSSANVEYY